MLLIYYYAWAHLTDSFLDSVIFNEIALNIMLISRRSLRKVSIVVCKVSLIISEINVYKMFLNNPWNYGSFCNEK